ncbi:MAG: THUMP domain-containing protein [Candidatus Atabeyarchaeum deiterrae]
MPKMDGQQSKLVFLLLGNYSTLPYSECISVLESNKIGFKEIKRLDQVLILSAPAQASQVVVRQAGMVRRSCILLAESPSLPHSLFQAVDSVDLNQILRPETSFAVRVKGVKDSSKGLNISELEREIGGRIKRRNKWTHVDLDNPDVLFYVLMTDNRALFCLNMCEAEEKGFTQRRPSFRPFFHPSSMHPRLARAMVNLSGAKFGSRFADPLCGSGGILMEAGVIGCHIVGIDIDLRMAKGSKKNLDAFGLPLTNICVGDARHMPIMEIDAVATDPPYGRSSSTKGDQTSKLVEEFLREITWLLRAGSKVCLATPSSVDIDALVPRELTLTEKYSLRVHRSLTRIMALFVRK